ncbi:LuxR C-terminal-related transcriptional regulator [Streptomyces nojiriensis]|uniref:helix-turn-helix transcriptional regulator n=1 Tax=Streptomyces nojiriensis TaxID=66374 RepID=UPI0035DCA1C6
MLEALGVGPSVEAVYRAVLEQPEWDIQDLASHLNLSDTAIRQALNALADLHLLEANADSPADFRPVSPEVGLTALLARSEAELQTRQRQIEATRSAVASLAAQYTSRKGYAPETVSQLVGLDAVRRRLEELAQHARLECLSFLPNGAQLPDTMEASKPLDQQALERGVQMRNIYQESFRNDPATLQYVRWMSSLGGETRTVPSLPMLMVIVDREVALVPMDPNDGRQGAVELRSHGAVAAMRVLFSQFWEAATPWQETPPADRNGLSRRDREILMMLATGRTDQWIAHQLGVSLRTIRRNVSDLMDRLDARSRFEAGVLAERANWF